MRLDRERSKLNDIDNLFKTHLMMIKKEISGIIPEKINPESDTSMWISGRRGSASEVPKQSLDQVAIDMNKIWRKREHEKGMEPSMEFRENCTQV